MKTKPIKPKVSPSPFVTVEENIPTVHEHAFIEYNQLNKMETYQCAKTNLPPNWWVIEKQGF